MARTQINIREVSRGRGEERTRQRVHRWEEGAAQRRAEKDTVREINASDAVTEYYEKRRQWKSQRTNRHRQKEGGGKESKTAAAERKKQGTRKARDARERVECLDGKTKKNPPKAKEIGFGTKQGAYVRGNDLVT